MMHILISFHSDYGHTEKMALAIAAGCEASFPDAIIKILAAEHTQLDDFEHADIIFLGTPVHMGSMAWGMKKLLDNTSKLWMEGLLEGKVGGVFACSGGLGGAGGGIEQTLISLHSLLLEHGMIAVGFPKNLLGYADAGIQWGVAARTGNHEGIPQGISEQALTACRSYGGHVCRIAERLR
ncbi:MAG: flavodoxin domain-containing protein [Mariprofundaceae bacterium]|nr:flavodoxin domain-containing protein [Mariprofundaceae bacterium]